VATLDGTDCPQFGRANVNNLVQLPNSYYDDPRFSWLQPIGVVSIQFLRSARFPADIRDQAVVSESNNHRLYLFQMNANRDGFDFSAFPHSPRLGRRQP
jgi:hypothetical protein